VKCDFCSWQERPESLPQLTRHLNGNHWGLTSYEVVWRSGEIVLARDVETGDTVLSFDRPKFIVPPEPEVVKYANPSDIKVTLEGTVKTNPAVVQGTTLFPASDPRDEIGRSRNALVPEEVLRSEGNGDGRNTIPLSRG